MDSKKAPIDSPSGFRPAPTSLTAAKGCYDHLEAPEGLNKPRSMGPNSLPEKITDGNLGATVPTRSTSMNDTDFVPGKR